MTCAMVASSFFAGMTIQTIGSLAFGELDEVLPREAVSPLAKESIVWFLCYSRVGIKVCEVYDPNG